MNRYIDLVFKFKDYKNTQDFKNILKSIIVISENFKFYKYFIQFNKKKEVQSTLIK